jgi:hypothetical protein
MGRMGGEACCDLSYAACILRADYQQVLEMMLMGSR